MAIRPTITIGSGGSDTQASGSGGTAVFGTAAATAASTVVTLLVDNPDLSGVATDGSAAIWILSSSGIQFSRITNKDNTAGVKTVTVATAFANTESGKTWAIGGKRLTIDDTNSRTLIETATPGLKAGWKLFYDNAQTIAATLTPTCAGDTTDGAIIIGSASGRLTLTCSANAPHFTMSSANPTHLHFWNMNYANSNGTKTNANAFAWTNGGIDFNWYNCGMDATNKCLRWHNRASGATPVFTHINCDIANCTGTEAMNLISSSNALTFINCTIHNNSGNGVNIDSGLGFVFINCLGYANAGHAVVFPSPAGNWSTIVPRIIFGCTFDAATGSNSGVNWTSAGTAFPQQLVWMNNACTNNGAYGVDSTALSELIMSFNGYNAYNGNTTSAAHLMTVNGSTILTGVGSITTAPGYTGTPNFANTAYQGVGHPPSSGTIAGVSSGTTTYPPIGAAQSNVSGGGSTTYIFPVFD